MTLTSIAGKTLQRLVKPHFVLNKRAANDPNQYGFKANFSVTDALINVIDFAHKLLERGQCAVRILLLDFSSAFDTIRHKRLIQRLVDLGCPRWLVVWMVSFLSGRVRIVIIGDAQSGKTYMTIGGPQGEVLSPDLFTMETDDMTINNVLQQLVKFADDSTLVAVVSNKEEFDAYITSINNIADQCDEKGLILNADKTKEIIVDFSKGRRISSALPRATMRGVEIERVACEKLLGFQLCEDLKPHEHINYRIKQANQRLFLLYRLRKAGLPRTALAMFYEQGIRSILEPASPVFHHALTVDDQERLGQVQRRAERCIRDGKVRASLQQRREEACAKLFDKMRERNDPLLPPLRAKHIPLYRAASNVADGQLTMLKGTKRYTDSFVPAQTRAYNYKINKDNIDANKRKLYETRTGTFSRALKKARVSL